jgi:hypothetical protein
VPRSDNRNTKLQVWLSKEDFEKLEQFLDKFSAGDDFSDQLSALFNREPSGRLVIPTLQDAINRTEQLEK